MQDTIAPTLVLTNGNLITLDDRRPCARAMAVRDGRIVFVGDDRDVERLAGPSTQRIDLAGRTVVPGFIDSHIHLLWYGSQLLRQAELTGTATVDDILQRLTDLSRRLSSGWILGHGFDQSKLKEQRFPTRGDLDRVSRDRPIMISRICGHAVIVNSAALALVSPEARARGDERTGLYTEDGASAFHRAVPQLAEEELEQAVLAAARVALRTGITSVQTLLDDVRQMIGYSRLHARGELPLRVIGIPPQRTIDSLHAHGIRTGFGDMWLRFGGAKFFSDGSLGAQTALLSSPYHDKPDTLGIRMYDPQALKTRCREVHEKGFQIAIHAIGDQALRESLGAIEHALAGEDNRRFRHRIEHASLCPPDCIERMARLGIIATLQPQFVTSDTWTGERIGPQRLPWAYPFRSMIEAGVPVTLSSDCPVERLDAFACLASAVGGHPWRPGQTLSFEQALRAYCLGSAYAGGMEKQLGSLEPGKLADFVVLSDDPTDMSAEKIAQLRAQRVFINGVERLGDG